MPIYEYACRQCGGRFERIRGRAERLNAPACPECASAETMLVMSVAGKVGGSAASLATVPACEGGRGSCCGGGACMH